MYQTDKTYMQDLNIHLHAIEHYSPGKMMKLWIKDMPYKSTMSIYIKFNHIIMDEQYLYDNTALIVTLFRARTGILKLNLERRHVQMVTPYVTCVKLT